MGSSKRLAGYFVGLNLALGALLCTFMVGVESMEIRAWAETPTHYLYNALYGFSLPALALASGLRSKVADPHHLSLSLRAFAFFLTPWLVNGFVGSILLLRFQRAKQTLPNKPTPKSVGNAISRRVFLVGASDAVLVGGTAAFSGYSTWYEPWALTLRTYDIPIAGLPKAMDGYRIVQISDTHYGPFIPLEHIRNTIQRCNALKPDFVVLTGDYVHRAQNAIGRAVHIFEEIQSKHGVTAVLGNHDHWEGADAVRKAFGDLSLPMLDNTRVFLGADGRRDEARPGEVLCLAGVGDLWEDLVLIPRALKLVDPDVPRILLSHNPDVAERRDHDERIDLMLSGHTHGGQISVPYRGTIMIPSSFGQKYAGGLCKGPRFPVIVSRGVGMAVMPYRFRVRPELVQVTLRAARA